MKQRAKYIFWITLVLIAGVVFFSGDCNSRQKETIAVTVPGSGFKIQDITPRHVFTFPPESSNRDSIVIDSLRRELFKNKQALLKRGVKSSYVTDTILRQVFKDVTYFDTLRLEHDELNNLQSAQFNPQERIALVEVETERPFFEKFVSLGAEMQHTAFEPVAVASGGIDVNISRSVALRLTAEARTPIQNTGFVGVLRAQIFVKF